MGGGSSNDAQKAADKAEAERQRQIQQSTAAINAIFDSPERQAQYDKLAGDTTTYLTGDLDRQKAVADRKLKFALARSGQVGGSLQADEGKVLGEDYSKGLVQATQRGLQAGAGLRGEDEATRQSLIAMAQAGLDTTTASSEAASALRANLEAGKANSTANSLADVFGDLSGVYNNSLDAKAQRAGQKYGYGQLYSPMYGIGQQPTSSGVY